MSLHVPPDKAALAAFVDAMFRHGDRDSYVVFKAFDDRDRPVFSASGTRLGHAPLIDYAFNLARQAANHLRPAVFCPPVCTFRAPADAKGRWSARTEDLVNGLTLSVDADKAPDLARETLTGLLGVPTVTAASGGLWVDPETGEVQEKLHLHWRLSEPTRTADRHALLHEARWLACMIVGGDPTLAPIVHPLRWPGSVHTKAEPRLARIVDLQDRDIDLDEVLVILRSSWTGAAFGTSERVERESCARIAEYDDIVSACKMIPNADRSWDDWKRIGLAIWAATEGHGFDIFDAWSRKSSKYGDAETVAAWHKIDRSPPSQIGAGSLFFEANEADPTWVRPSQRSDGDEFAEVVAMEAARAESSAIAQVAPRPCVSLPAFPDHLTWVPGLLGEMIDWIVATDKRPNRVLALGAALSALGTIVGRRLAGPTLSGTHLYVIALAPSGAGKDHGLHQAARLIKATNQHQLVGPSGFMSFTAAVRFILKQPLSLCIMDELGAFLKKLSHRKAGIHEQGITAVLRTAWGCSFQAMRTPEWSGQASEEIPSPALSIYGVSVPEEFFAAMQGSDVTNGFLNRFLLLETDRGSAVAEHGDPFVVPDALRDRLIDLYFKANALDASSLARPWDDLRPTVLPWLGDAGDVCAAFQAEMEPLRNHPEQAPFFARTVEMGVRLATIRAAGQGLHGVTREDMAWGRDVAVWSARRMVEAAGEHMAGNEFAAYQNRIAGFMKRKGTPVTKRDMQRAVQSELTVRQLDEAIATMVQSGRIVPQGPKREPGSRGRPPPTHYRLATS